MRNRARSPRECVRAWILRVAWLLVLAGLGGGCRPAARARAGKPFGHADP